jgi:hypothetical protein
MATRRLDAGGLQRWHGCSKNEQLESTQEYTMYVARGSGAPNPVPMTGLGAFPTAKVTAEEPHQVQRNST